MPKKTTPSPFKLDIACGSNLTEGFVGMDIVKSEGVRYVGDILDFGEKSVWRQIPDNSVDEIVSNHFLEHIPHGDGFHDPFFQFFDEVYRVLKPATFSPDNPNIPISGMARFVVPYYTSMRAFQDPTHQRYITDMTLYYLDADWRKANKLDHYAVKANFNFAAGYNENARLANRNQEFKQTAFGTEWNAIDDLVFMLWKKP